MRERNEFAWDLWLKPLGLPVALALAEWEWERDHSVAKTLAIAAGVLAATYAVSQVDYQLHKRDLQLT